MPPKVPSKVAVWLEEFATAAAKNIKNPAWVADKALASPISFTIGSTLMELRHRIYKDNAGRLNYDGQGVEVGGLYEDANGVPSKVLGKDIYQFDGRQWVVVASLP